MSFAIVTEDLSKHYEATRAVDQVSLHVGTGEIYGFLGLNGAGKSTTIRMLLGLVRPTLGSATILNIPVSPGAKTLWGKVGYVVETPAAYPELTVRDNLELVRRLRGVDDTGAVDRVCNLLGLTRYAGTAAGTLSLGNRQRLGLAKALIHDPRVLILDEPVNALDPVSVVEVRALLLHLARDHGITIFMSSHVLAEVARLADRIGVIHDGRLLVELDANSLAQQQRRWLEVGARDLTAAARELTNMGFSADTTRGDFLIIESASAVSAPDQIAAQLVIRGIPPTHLSIATESLEDYFLRIVDAASESVS